MILTRKSKNSGQSLINKVVEQDVIIENEIECPRCFDVMTLCSDFDSTYYVCNSCDFCLYTIKK